MVALLMSKRDSGFPYTNFGNFATNPSAGPDDKPTPGVTLPITKEANAAMNAALKNYSTNPGHRGYTLFGDRLFECYGQKTNGVFYSCYYNSCSAGGYGVYPVPGQEPSLTGDSAEGPADGQTAEAVRRGALDGIINAALDKSSAIYNHMSSLASFTPSEQIFSGIGFDAKPLRDNVFGAIGDKVGSLFDDDAPDLSPAGQGGSDSTTFVIAIVGQTIGEIREFPEAPIYGGGGGGSTGGGGGGLNPVDTLNALLERLYDKLDSTGPETEGSRLDFINTIGDILDVVGKGFNLAEDVGDFVRAPFEDLAGQAFDTVFSSVMNSIGNLIKSMVSGAVNSAHEESQKQAEHDANKSQKCLCENKERSENDSTSSVIDDESIEKYENLFKKFFVTSTHEETALLGNIADVSRIVEFVEQDPAGADIYAS